MMDGETGEYDVGDRVRIDIPDETDPGHDRYHGEHGQIVDILEDEAGTLTGDDRVSIIYWVQFMTQTPQFNCMCHVSLFKRTLLS